MAKKLNENADNNGISPVDSDDVTSLDFAPEVEADSAERTVSFHSIVNEEYSIGGVMGNLKKGSRYRFPEHIAKILANSKFGEIV